MDKRRNIFRFKFTFFILTLLTHSIKTGVHAALVSCRCGVLLTKTIYSTQGRKLYNYRYLGISLYSEFIATAKLGLLFIYQSVNIKCHLNLEMDTYFLTVYGDSTHCGN